jgi:hypothetical protein
LSALSMAVFHELIVDVTSACSGVMNVPLL